MTREEADQLIAEVGGIQWRNPVADGSFQEILRLARLGAAVIAPNAEEIEAMGKRFQAAYGLGFFWNDISEEHREAVRVAIRAALRKPGGGV